ncbi:MAG: amidohydrolase family protein, partial [Actinobacteria bacterium]|nr:amidohydrolase family protein [Actinomycetota bacterium]
EMMVEAGTWLVPTLTAGDTTEAYANDEKLAPEVREKFKGLGRPEFDAMKLAAEAGVKVAMGTDAPVAPHGTNLNELMHMANNGFTPEQALVAATSSAAELMGLQEDLGTIEPGKLADLVVVDGDPFAFDTLKDRVEQVFKAGQRVI